MFSHAITRLPDKNFANGLTTTNLGSPDYALILQQHHTYRQALLSLGLDIVVLPPEPAYPDAYFVEDPAIITPKIAVITRPGAPSRQGEEETIEPILKYYRPLAHITSPGTLDGGDVLMVGEHFFIGFSERTNNEGVSQLSTILSRAGYTCDIIPITSGLHLKSSVNFIGENTLLITEDLASNQAFSSYRKIIVDEEEAYAANTLWVNHVLLTPKGYPKVYQKLTRLGMRIIELDVSEVQKMDGGLTCMSLRF
jgi:dimethylargininase